MFQGSPTYNPYRSLRLTDPRLVGEDVYGLQIALNAVGNFKTAITADGILGPKTAKAIEGYQRKNQLVADGIAGPATQRHLALKIGKEVQRTFPLPPGLPAGQLQHESGFLLGNYSRPPRDDGSFDAGVAQRNSNYHDLRDAFDPVDSIELLCGFVYDRFQLYSAASNLSERRCWELAAGAWNAPYYANYLAGVRPWAEPGPTALAKLEEYIDSVCAYLDV